MSVALRLVHAAFAIALVGWLIATYLERRQELGKVQEAASSERRETQRVQADIERGKALRDGLKRDDPYVIEYLARDRLQYAGPGEMNPPPR